MTDYTDINFQFTPKRAITEYQYGEQNFKLEPSKHITFS